MNVEENQLNPLETQQKAKYYDGKLIPSFLKYLGKIKSINQYDQFKKHLIVLILNKTIEIAITSFILFLCLSLLGIVIGSTPLFNLSIAAGASLLWMLIVEFKKDLWRR